jgi:hypothetical protein
MVYGDIPVSELDNFFANAEYIQNFDWKANNPNTLIGDVPAVNGRRARSHQHDRVNAKSRDGGESGLSATGCGG